MSGRAARAAALVLGAGLALVLTGCGQDEPAVAPAATPDAEAPPQAEAPTDGQTAPDAGQTQEPTVTTAPEPGAGTGDAATGRSAIASPGFADPETNVVVSGTNWPPRQLVTATVCGNNFLNGSVDCATSASGQGTARADGTFTVQLTVALPPKPCPCVIHVVSAGDTGTVDLPFEIPSAPEAPPSKLLITRGLDVIPRLEGSGPWQALFGGAAERELVLEITNAGSSVLIEPQVNLTYGRGDDPTTPLLGEDGQPIRLGIIQIGESIEYRQTVRFDAPAYGKYVVKGEFVGLDRVTVDGELVPLGQATFRTTTSTYPWALIALAWLLLQIPLLGLYKRRPVVAVPDQTVEAVEPDPAVVPSGFDLAPAAGAVPPPPQPPPGFSLVAPPAPVSGSQAGVNDLRSYLDRGY